MLTSLNAYDQQFLNNLDRVSDRMNRAQAQITTGVKMAKVSDDPDQVSTLLSARAALSSAAQVQSSLGRVTAEVDAAEQALENAVQLFERARTLGAQGATGTQTAATRASIAGEIGSILGQLVAVTSTQVEGRYVFSGDADRLAPYTIDLNLATPVSAYLGATSTRQIQHPNGTTFLVGHSAQEIFDSADPATNVFATITSLRDAMLANDESEIRTSLDAFTRSSDHLNGELAFYGTTQNKLRDATNFGVALQLQLKTQISSIEDADLTEAILEMKQGQIQQEAALSARSQLPRQTLFDFLR
jgi:flagellar hook-associated protein 3 FlgL